MSATTITLLHPGEMGAQIGRCLRSAGARVLWVEAGRSAASRARAVAAGLTGLPSLQAALSQSGYLLSVVPPDRALEVGAQVAQQRFRGVFVDANAIAPATARQIAQLVAAGGAQFVDGGLIGRPPAAGAGCRLYLSGACAGDVAALFAGSDVMALPMAAPVGAASALKMCYAAWSKLSMLLAVSVWALARHEDVQPALAEEWRRSRPQMEGVLQLASGSARKAWRWVGEAEQIAASFDAAGLPEGFAAAAAQLCRRLQSFKDVESVSLEHILDALNAGDGPTRGTAPP